MSHRLWDKKMFDEFVEQAMLDNEFKVILHDRIHKIPQAVTADNLGISISTLNRKLKELQQMYDVASRHSDMLPENLKII